MVTKKLGNEQIISSTGIPIKTPVSWLSHAEVAVANSPIIVKSIVL